eukprot:6725261-Pyramimonas_sp.AAC.1
MWTLARSRATGARCSRSPRFPRHRLPRCNGPSPTSRPWASSAPTSRHRSWLQSAATCSRQSGVPSQAHVLLTGTAAASPT